MAHHIGDKHSKRYTITGVVEIAPGKYWRNQNITHRLSLLGSRGSKAIAYVFADGNVGKAEADQWRYREGRYLLDGDTGELVEQSR